MRGPRGRLALAVGRRWECPQCHRQELSSGAVVNQVCYACTAQDSLTGTWMRLIDEFPKKRPVTLPMAIGDTDLAMPSGAAIALAESGMPPLDSADSPGGIL
jgi:hypothetical protein